MSIRLHPTLGVNPVLTYCCRCGGDSPELILAGDSRIYQCPDCKQKMMGQRPENCPNCKIKMIYVKRFEPGYDTRLPSQLPCDKCKEELAMLKKHVEEGGIYWRCKDCHAEGVIKKSDYAKAVRKKMGVEIPKPCGVEFCKADCPTCGPNA